MTPDLPHLMLAGRDRKEKRFSSMLPQIPLAHPHGFSALEILPTGLSPSCLGRYRTITLRSLLKIFFLSKINQDGSFTTSDPSVVVPPMIGLIALLHT